MAHNMTVTVDDKLWKEMQKHDDIRWSVVMRRAVQEKLGALAALGAISHKTPLSEDEIEKISVDIGKKIHAHL